MPPFPDSLEAPTPTPTPNQEPASPEMNRASFFLSIVPAIATIGGVVILWSLFWLYEQFISGRETKTADEDPPEGAAAKAPGATTATGK
ncbi:hypothetical protein GGF32_006250 [Allomyces javanicus]|nr:hypothetical protein GGF32_006250 [Allomyces javanicus]